MIEFTFLGMGMVEIAFLGLGVLFIIGAIARFSEHRQEEKRFSDLIDRVIKSGK